MREHKPAFQEDSAQSLFQELRDRVKREGIDTYGEYCELIQELLQEKLNDGIFNVNEDLSTIESDLEGRWLELEGLMR
ncbi:MAG: hypothetical protein HGA31_06025 [Candidatus Moranbacteria bacterium]|nr:hypothetical protein [Candidatus Moranbacteria bacterium]